ncbi:YncE family protein [Pedococcus sp. 5OH_020]|uniref:YncE family protein n=1 Tax=Pedococcus sp. 5OH_020 TaxID=2989814 RepID=UPI0022E9E1C6|nr:YncE family protein [Pedococcus sp. 5OH_020]
MTRQGQSLTRGRGRGRVVGVLGAVMALAGCSADPTGPTASAGVSSVGATATATTSGISRPTTAAANDVYAAATPGALSAVASSARSMVYVPNTLDDTVQLIDPKTYAVVGRFRTGREPQHVVPAWDLRTLWVNADRANTLTPVDPRTGRAGRPVPVADPYNLYFTPDGKHALVMAERLRRIDVRDPHTMRLQRSLRVPCHGVNHADYTADLRFLLASCEFDGKLVVTDRDARSVRKVIDLNKVSTPGATSPHEAMQLPGSPKSELLPGSSAMPQDVRLTPDGRHFVVADMLRNGVWVIDARTMRCTGFVHTGLGAHGIYPSRDATRLYVSNRDAGTVSVLDARTLRPVALWRVPGGGSPDMGGVTADGKELWLSGRYDKKVYVFDTRTGKVTHTIAVDAGPHGLCVWPQPGRFSLGHTGNMR